MNGAAECVTLRHGWKGWGSPAMEAFEQNEVDFDILPHLTEPMLEKFGLPLPAPEMVATDRSR
jgi:hypothetical protein